MVGLSASDLRPQTLKAGETLEYYTRAFVCGDPRGQRIAVVTRVDTTPDVDYPISVDTEEPIPLDMMTKRLLDASGAPVPLSESQWRKLQTYQLEGGSVPAPSRSSVLKRTLQSAVSDAVAAVHQALRDMREDIVPESPQSDFDSPDTDILPGTNISSSYSDSIEALTSGAIASHDVKENTREEEGRRPSILEIINLVSSEEDDDREVAVPTEDQAAAYVKAIPSRHVRAKIRHQPKKRRAEWHVPKSRKRCNQKKCAVTSSGMNVYHARTLKASRMKDILSSPEVKRRLRSLHDRRKSLPETPSQEEEATSLQHLGMEWPDDVEHVTSCRNNGVVFPDIEKFDKCECVIDCFLDGCKNVFSATFCTPHCCSLGALCSNAPRTLDTLKLFDTGRVGLGVFTTTGLDIGDVVGEYCGDLSEFPAIVEGQPEQATKQNSGYTLLYNAKSSKRNYVYVDALKCGSITRFIRHSCGPNAAFVEQSNRSSVQVLVKMIRDVKAGAEITVHYRDERWFKCACDKCWEKTQHGSGDD
eukprot:jgi/Phyca11/125892/e_gw1.60.72.1